MPTPENFKAIILDLVNDLTTTFPEFSDLWKSWQTAEVAEFDTLFQYCLTVYPERFFDILYQNVDIFGKDSTSNTMFLPSVDFKVLFNCDGVTENTKKTLWKYLQLILFNVVGSIDDPRVFKRLEVLPDLTGAPHRLRLRETRKISSVLMQPPCAGREGHRGVAPEVAVATAHALLLEGERRQGHGVGSVPQT